MEFRSVVIIPALRQCYKTIVNSAVIPVFNSREGLLLLAQVVFNFLYIFPRKTSGCSQLEYSNIINTKNSLLLCTGFGIKRHIMLNQYRD